ncbi:hypothetical protein GGS21DRAFT_487596 [Xylaria nigripes]|nr:hypothetical protein GGS21DRAFT_487596 [Xylaria nigripes]
MFYPRFEYGTRLSLRNCPVLVSLEPGAKDYVCERMGILQHIPNTRHTPFGRTFHPHFALKHWRQPVLEALHALFHGLERYRATGTRLYLFERARDWLEELLQQIDEFAIDLMNSHELSFFTGNRRLPDFFMAYSTIFQPTTRRHIDTLRELDSSVPRFVCGRLVTHLTAVLDTGCRRSNLNAMFRTMRDLRHGLTYKAVDRDILMLGNTLSPLLCFLLTLL